LFCPYKQISAGCRKRHRLNGRHQPKRCFETLFLILTPKSGTPPRRTRADTSTAHLFKYHSTRPADLHTFAGCVLEHHFERRRNLVGHFSCWREPGRPPPAARHLINFRHPTSRKLPFGFPCGVFRLVGRRRHLESPFVLGGVRRIVVPVSALPGTRVSKAASVSEAGSAELHVVDLFSR